MSDEDSLKEYFRERMKKYGLKKRSKLFNILSTAFLIVVVIIMLFVFLYLLSMTTPSAPPI